MKECEPVGVGEGNGEISFVCLVDEPEDEVVVVEVELGDDLLDGGSRDEHGVLAIGFLVGINSFRIEQDEPFLPIPYDLRLLVDFT